MKYLTFTALALSVVFAGQAQAESNKGNTCQRKEQAIMRQLEFAKQHNNQGKIRGLEKALENVRLWCSNDGLLSKAEDKIEDRQDKVKEREEELAEALAEGKGKDKITKREKKLEEARSELKQAVGERDTLLESIKREGE